MEKIKVFGHGSYIGTTGYNHHTRKFFRELSKYTDLKFRNYTIGKSWDGMSDNPHDKEDYIDNIDKKILKYQTLHTPNNNREEFPMYQNSKDFIHDVNIILNETNHYYFYDIYEGPKIAYNVWESTKQPEEFFNRLKEFDEVWVPSKWQRDCTIQQGIDSDRVKVVPEGVDVDVFFPEDVTHPLTSDGRFKFFIAGRWDYRKSTKELIETFLKTFNKDEPVDLIVSVDNPFSNDGLSSTEERLNHYGLNDSRIKVLHFPPREDYIKLIKSCNVFLSCARSEGWNLPLIESMACGIPSIYSNCSGQLEFAENKGLPVKISGELPVNASNYNHFNDGVGNYYEPDFEDLSKVMRESYENYEFYKKKSIEESSIIRNEFNWEKIGKIGLDILTSFIQKVSNSSYTKPHKKNKINISYVNGPKVEILGDEDNEYYVEFIDSSNNEVIHSSTIRNNMWTSCGRKYYTKWIIKINDEVVDEFNLKDKKVLISLDSKSIGDTLAWAPYAVEFQKKHNCEVVLSTFHNKWFMGLESYKNIKFLEPGHATDCYVVYYIGWFRDDNNRWEKFDYYPTSVNLIPLQQTASDILGLDYVEVNHGVKFNIEKKNPLRKKYVVFGPQATSGCKEWVYEYWSSLAKLIKNHGYEVVLLTSTPYHIHGVKNISGRPLDEVVTYLYHAEFFVGLGSGLSWLNWSLGKHTFMINGFSVDGHEFTENITKISTNKCIKCWNDPVHVFDAGDWDWCPVYKGSKLQHTCQKSIYPIDVYNQIKSWLL